MDWTDPNWCPVCGTDLTAADHPEVWAEKMRNWRPRGISRDRQVDGADDDDVTAVDDQ